MHKILIVDDELNMRLVLDAMLRKEGYAVVTAADGLEALDILTGNDVAVVVTDLKMPRLDGMGLLAKVMQDYPAIPVIMITAHGTVNNAVDALKQGAFDYITKPFEQDDIKNAISKAIMTRTLRERDVLPSPQDVDWYGIVGESAGMVQIREAIRTVALTMTTVSDHGRNRNGKGTHRPGGASQQSPQGQPLHQDQLCRHSGKSHGERTLRF